MIVSKRAVEEFLSKPRNSYTWMKRLNQQQLVDEINQLRIKPHFKTDPWLHQLVCFMISIVEPRFLFLLDMGTGKSKILLDRMTYARQENNFKKALVTVPNLVNLGTWENAVLTHSDFEPWLIEGSIEEKWERLLQPQGDVSVIDYAGLHLATCSKLGKSKKKLVRDDRKIAQLLKVYNFVGIDESHKVKNKDTLRYGIMRQLTKRMDYVYATTGTPFGRNVEDMYGQFYLVDHGESLGDTLGMFRSAFMTEEQDYWKGTIWTFDKRKARPLYRAMQNKSIRYDENECNDLPSRKVIPIKLKFNKEQREHYLRAVEGLIGAHGRFSELEAPWIRLRQIISGYLHWEDEYGKHHLEFKENAKLDMTQSLIEDSGESKIVISYEYTPTGQMLVDRVKQLGLDYEWLYGKSKDPRGCVSRFIKDPNKRVLIMNSEAGGTGTDGLQDVARYLVFYESPPSPITRKQVIKRVHRPGQHHKVVIYDLVLEGSVDKRVLDFIEEGNDLHDLVVEGKFKLTRDTLLGK